MIAEFVPRLAEVAAEESALRFEDGGDLQVFASGIHFAAPDVAEPAAKPRVAERAVEGDGLVEGIEGGGDAIL